MFQGRREQELDAFSKLRKFWKIIQKKDAKESEESKVKLEFERHFLQRLMHKFLLLLSTIPLEGRNFSIYLIYSLLKSYLI